MASRATVLFLGHTSVARPDGGAEARGHHLLRVLTRDFDVVGLAFSKPRAGVPDVERPSGFPVDVEYIPLPPPPSRLRIAMEALRRRPYTSLAYASDAFRTRLHGLLQERPFDVVHVESLDLQEYLSAVVGLPVVCHHHNVESDLLRKRSYSEGSWSRRAGMRVQASLIERIERHWSTRVAMNVLVSEVDAARLREIAQGAPTSVVPNGVDADYFMPGPEGDGDLVSVGGLTWFPNRDALEFLGSAILPLIRRQLGRPVKAQWIGAAIPDVAASAEASGIDVPGYLPDIRPAVRAARCFVAPLRVGGGTRLKILDAWAMGKAVVSTRIGCEGLEATNGVNILIRDDPGQFAEAVVQVLVDSDLRKRLGVAGRAFVEQRYRWEIAARPLVDLYRRLARRDA